MNNGLLRCVVLIIYLIFQVQVIAAETNYIYKNDIASKFNFKEVFFLNNFFSSNVSESIFFAEQEIFSIRAEVDNNGCFTGNSNNVAIRFIIKNITNVNQVIEGRTAELGNKLQLVSSSGVSVDGFSGSSNLLTNARTLAPGEEFVIDGTFYNAGFLTVQEVLASVKFKFANFRYSGISNSQIGEDIQTLESSATISRIPDNPTTKSARLNPLGRNLLYNSLEINIEDVDLYVFYKDGVEVPFDHVINNNDLTGYTFKNATKYSKCLSTGTAGINFSVVAISDLPSAGSISTANNSICDGGTVIINNLSLGQGTPVIGGSIRYALKYTWEISYDNGVTWQIPSDTTSSDSDGANSITISNVTSDFLIRRKATERPTTTRGLYYNYTDSIAISVVKNSILFPTGTTNAVATRLLRGTTSTEVSLPIVSATLPNSTITYYKPDGSLLATNPSGTSLPIGNLGEGEYIYQVTATNSLSSGGTCTITELIKVIVYNASDCFSYIKRIPATVVKDWTSGISFVTNEGYAVDGNKADGASLNGGVVLLGIGTVGVDLYFTKADGSLYTGEELKGKRVTIKLGEQYSGAKVAGGITVVGRLTNNGVTAETVSVLNSSNVGATFGVKGGVLDALKGDNVFEYSFVPASSITSNATPVAYNGVRIQLGSLLGVADLAKVFYAYIEDEGVIDGDNDISTSQYCQLVNQEILVTPSASLLYPTSQPNTEGIDVSGIANQNIKLNRSVEDIFWGNYSEVLNVGSSLNSIIYPYYAVDDNYDSYSLFSTTLGVLNAQFLQAKLRQKARLGDQIQITLSYPNISIVDLKLLQLGNFKLVYYLNGAKVGEDLLEEFRVLDIGLFRFRDRKRVILSKPANFMFDKVELFQFSAIDVELGEGIKVYDIRVNPLIAFNMQQDPKSVTQVCAADPLIIEKPDDCTTYQLSFARVTQFGVDNYKNADGTDLLDYKGDLIYPIEDFTDLTIEELSALGINQNSFTSIDYPGQLKAYFDLNLAKLFTGELYNGKMLIKIQAIRQGCDYGEPQYLRVDFVNCNEAIVNPVLKNSGIY